MLVFIAYVISLLLIVLLRMMDQNPNRWINGAILFIRNLCKYVNSVV